MPKGKTTAHKHWATGLYRFQSRLGLIFRDRHRRLAQVQRQHDQRVNNEDAMRSLKEEEVMQMEKLEMELIKKLQNTQAVQKEAYQELERALKEPSAMIAP